MAAEEDLKRRNELLEMVNEAAGMLLSSDTDDLEDVLLAAMSLMAHSVEANGMYIWRTRTIDGKPRYEQQYKWSINTGKAGPSPDKKDHVYMDTIPAWDECFSAGNCINGPVSSLPDTQRNILSGSGICSILVIPVFLHDTYWGFVSFDDCQRERSFLDDEVSILRSGCLLLASTIVRSQNKILLETRIAQQKLMAAISRSFISKEPMDQLINEALRKIGEFLEATRIAIFTTDANSDECLLVYSWFCCDQWKPVSVRKGFNKIIHDVFPPSIPETGFITALYCNDVENEYRGKYKKVSAMGIKSFIWAPIYVNNVFWGLISVEECVDNRLWTESDIQLVGTVSSAIAGAVARDLIDKARTEALEDAVQASKAKGNFLANMSHEIRTPMNAIIGMTSIGKNSRDVGKKDYAFDKIENASTHLLGIINDILDMSKIEADKLELSLISFNFEKMLQKVVNVINFRIEERQQEFTVHIDEEVPRFLVGDDQRLAQVITNLLSNAVKFTPDMGNIRLSAKVLGEENGLFTIETRVSDSGIGITEEQKARLFSSFEQAESGTSRKFGGTGLGLAISKRIVELMGGRIWIESEVGKGSTFAFTIQAQEGQDVSSGILASRINIKNLRILAIDDSHDVLEYFNHTMQRFGITCDTATSREEGLALVEKNGHYDIFFVDWHIPGTDTIELCREISKIRSLENESDKPLLIMMSSADMGVIEQEAKAAGVDKFLTKPLFPSIVADLLNECLGDHRLEEAGMESEGEGVDNFEKFTMLLAEDVDINREIVLTLLEPTGLTIDCAENGKDAVKKFAANPDKYDMILMDVQMPEMDGYEATSIIRLIEGDRKEGKIPIVAMTANVFREDVEKCLEVGMDDHLGKPLDFIEVMEKLRKYLLNKS